MTGRRSTDAEKRRLALLNSLLEETPSNYVASAPYLFANRQQVTSALSRLEIFKLVSTVPGAVIETGVFRGNSLMWLAQVSQVLEPFAINRKFVGFDTFEGFTSIDGNADPADVGESTFADTSLDTLIAAIDIFDADRPINLVPKVELIRGDVTVTAHEYVNSHPGLSVAMLILDTDLYKPTLEALRAFVPRMPRGGVILLDEYAYEFFPGETQAVMEFFAPSLPEIRRLPFDAAAAFIIV